LLLGGSRSGAVHLSYFIGMALPLHKQFSELIERSHRPVIVLPAGCGPDGFATAFALISVWGRNEKVIDVVAADGRPPKALKMFKSEIKVRRSFGALRKFVIDIDVSRTSLQELSYDVQDGRLSVYLTPKQGAWSPKDIATRTGSYKYDLIITLGAQDFEGFGDLFLKNTQFFYDTPVINIDHTAANEQFGQLNIVDLTATSLGEVMYKLIESWSHDDVTEEIATMLLMGMISKTRSFKTPDVTPTTLHRASSLVKRGAKRAEIVDRLFRTRSVETLRLWGRVLARLKKDSESKLVWSLLTQQDFALAGADESDLSDVIDELIRNAPEARVVVLLYEDKERHVCGLISGGHNVDSLKLAIPFKPVGTQDLAQICFTDRSLPQAEKDVIEKLKERIKTLVS
jgi:bifunctional oligoribonuclease and PAP phosphatase NrnA